MHDTTPAAAPSNSPPASPRRSFFSSFRRVLVRWAVILSLIYIGFLIVLVSLETRLVYPGARGGDWNRRDIVFEEVWFTSGDGTRLNGRYLPPPPIGGQAVAPKIAMLMHHGNGENISMMLDEADRYRQQHGMPVLIYDYRGFGRSEGSPTEAGVLADAEAALEWLQKKTSLPPDRIVQFGRSLGGGVAVHVASKHDAAGLILDRTFSSIEDIAAERYWMFPVRWVIRNRYSSVEKIADYDGPLLQLHGDVDEIIAISYARQLFAAAGSDDKTFIESPGTGHLSPWPSAFTEATDRFLSRIAKTAEPAEASTP